MVRRHSLSHRDELRQTANVRPPGGNNRVPALGLSSAKGDLTKNRAYSAAREIDKLITVLFSPTLAQECSGSRFSVFYSPTDVATSSSWAMERKSEKSR